MQTHVLKQIDIQDLLYSSFSCISYLRDLFNEDCYSNDIFLGITIKRLKRTTNDAANRFIDWLEKGVYDAIKRKYLKKLVIGIYLDCSQAENKVFDSNGKKNKNGIYETNIKENKENKENECLEKKTEMAETYTFDFDYQEEFKITNESISSFIRNMCVLTQTLKPLPRVKYVTLKLFYFDTAPLEYEPPFFKHGNDNLYEFTTEPLRLEVGNSILSKGEVKARIKTLYDYSSKKAKCNPNNKHSINVKNEVSLSISLEEMKLDDKHVKKSEISFKDCINTTVNVPKKSVNNEKDLKNKTNNFLIENSGIVKKGNLNVKKNNEVKDKLSNDRKIKTNNEEKLKKNNEKSVKMKKTTCKTDKKTKENIDIKEHIDKEVRLYENHNKNDENLILNSNEKLYNNKNLKNQENNIENNKLNKKDKYNLKFPTNEPSHKEYEKTKEPLSKILKEKNKKDNIVRNIEKYDSEFKVIKNTKIDKESKIKLKNYLETKENKKINSCSSYRDQEIKLICDSKKTRIKVVNKENEVKLKTILKDITNKNTIPFDKDIVNKKLENKNINTQTDILEKNTHKENNLKIIDNKKSEKTNLTPNDPIIVPDQPAIYENYVIKCLCSVNMNDSDMLQCDKCDSWLHTVCCGFFSNSDKRIPLGKYICDLCNKKKMERPELLRKIACYRRALSIIYNEGIENVEMFSARMCLSLPCTETIISKFIREEFLKKEDGKFIVVKNADTKGKIKKYFSLNVGNSKSSVPLEDIRCVRTD